MLLTVGATTINTDHITRIAWDAQKEVAQFGKPDIRWPCVRVFYDHPITGGAYTDYTSETTHDDFTGVEAALLATHFHHNSTNLNNYAADADFIHKYPEPPPYEVPSVTNAKPATGEITEDVLPF